MIFKSFLSCTFILTLLLTACRPSDPGSKSKPSRPVVKKVTKTEKQVVIDLRPYSDMPTWLTSYVYSNLLKIYPNIKLHAPVPIPVAAYYPAKKRYRADTLIRLLATAAPVGHVSLGLTTLDISCTKDQFNDWGIFGYSYSPGRACVASTFRLKKYKSAMKEQFFKIAIHELGHTQGLPHCPVQSCFMRDARGGSPFHALSGFCPTCKTALKKAGWKL